MGWDLSMVWLWVGRGYFTQGLGRGFRLRLVKLMSAACNSRGAKKWQFTLWVEDLQAEGMGVTLESPLERKVELITGVLLAGVGAP